MRFPFMMYAPVLFVSALTNQRMNKILEGKLILLASHNPLDIDLLCDCVYELDAETIVSQRSILSQ